MISFQITVLHISAILICNTASFSQNLVPNPGFEDTVQCPTNHSQINYALGWDRPTNGTSDYFNTCKAGIVGVPGNIAGWQSAKEGQAYAGIYTADNEKLHSNPNWPAYSNYREYIQTQLTDTLVAGKRYKVSFYVSLADSVIYACNNIGAYFSSTPINVLNYWSLPYTPQISNDTLSNPLTDKNGWTLVANTFIATGNELYITIGNFNDSAHSDTVFVGGTGSSGPYFSDSASYYYIDDVEVQLYDSIIGVEENESSFFQLYPNPSGGMFNIVSRKLQIENIEVLNLYGKNDLLFGRYAN